MNKSLGVAVGVLVLIAAAVWFFSYGPSSMGSSMATSSDASTQATTSATSGSGVPKTPAKPSKGIPDSTTYKSLLTQTGSYECDYSSASGEGQTSNVIYIYGGKMRGEFRTISAGNSSGNLFVYDGHYMYQWKEGASIGTRTVLTSLSQLPLIIPKDLTSGAIVGNSYESVGWQCHSWLTNKALLTPPSYVTFR